MIDISISLARDTVDYACLIKVSGGPSRVPVQDRVRAQWTGHGGSVPGGLQPAADRRRQGHRRTPVGSRDIAPTISQSVTHRRQRFKTLDLSLRRVETKDFRVKFKSRYNSN